MALEDVVTYLVALALPVWLLVEQGVVWMAASGGERRGQFESGARSRRAHEASTLASSGAPEIQHRAA